MSALAQQHGAVNLGQGFPDFGCDDRRCSMPSTTAMRGRPQPVPADGRRGATARGHRGQGRDALYGRRLRSFGHRDHHHRRRDPGDPDRRSSRSCIRATRSSCSSPATTATSRTSTLAGGRVVARAADPWQLPARLRPDRRGALATHARDRDQQRRTTRAPPCLDARRRCSGCPTCCAPTEVLADLATRSTSTWSTTARPHESVARHSGAGGAKPSSCRVSARPIT